LHMAKDCSALIKNLSPATSFKLRIDIIDVMYQLNVICTKCWPTN